MQLWLDACPQRENPLIQKLALNMGKQQLIASQRVRWEAAITPASVLHHIVLDKGESANFQLHGHARICNRFTGNFMRLRIMRESGADLR